MTDLCDGFLAQVSENPRRVALICGNQTWTYGDFSLVVNGLSARLVEVAPGGRQQRVGVLAHRGMVEQASRMAALLCGAVYVPLSPSCPVSRTIDMMRQADVDVLVADGDCERLLPRLLGEVERRLVLLLPESTRPSLPGLPVQAVLDRRDIEPARKSDGFESAAGDSIAYIMFTSGSTGRPKGVPITVDNLRAFVSFNRKKYDLGPADVIAATFEHTFDLSLFAPLMAWDRGASVLVLTRKEMLAPGAVLRRHCASVWFSVPSAVRYLVGPGGLAEGSLDTLRYSLFCGEALSWKLVEAWSRIAPNSVIDNKYGPTECTVAILDYRWDPASSLRDCVNGIVPIGRPYPGHKTLIVDENDDDAAEEAGGELCIAGPQVFARYLGSTKVDHAVFVERFDEDGIVDRYYRTGDIVRRLPCGSLAYRGRRDHQVKINGYRVEPAEIEAGALEFGCLQAVALPWPMNEPRAMVAAVTGPVDIAALERHLANRLPPYMVPQRIAMLEALPLTDNGKVDRQRIYSLLETEFRSAALSDAEIRRGDVRRLVADVLGIDVGDVADELGFGMIGAWDSLRQVQMVLALEEYLGRSIDAHEEASIRSVRGIVEFVDGRSNSAARPTAEPSLRGVSVGTTSIFSVDVQQRQIAYCGYDMRDLVEFATVEQVAYLLLHREPGSDGQLRAFSERLANTRSVTTEVLDHLCTMSRIDAHPLDALSSSIAMLAAIEGGSQAARDRQTFEEAADSGVRLFAQMPTLIASYHAIRTGREPPPPDPAMGYAENFLFMLSLPCSRENIAAISRDAIIHADNGASSATFAALTATGAWASLHDSVAAAIHTFKGGRHGYAAETAYGQLVRLRGPNEVSVYVDGIYDKGRTPPGFGHAMYGSAGDPRFELYRQVVEEVAMRTGNRAGLTKIEAMLEASRRRTRGRIAPNLDVFQGLLYESLGLPLDLSIPMYVAYRTLGWIAHILEKFADQPLVRPVMDYVGEAPRRFPRERVRKSRYEPVGDVDAPADHAMRAR